ncbi:MAG: hypothetical protein R6V07_11110 [Armatimonadota bacterium]
MTQIRLCATLVALMLAPAWPGHADESLTLVGWGIDMRNVESFMTEAADVGFDALITGPNTPELLARAVEAGAKHDIAVYAFISPMGHVAREWNQQYPDEPIPWQVMTGDEEAALNFISAGDNKYLIPYQWGGEPVLTNEVLTTRTVCFSDGRAREILEGLIDEIASVPGLEGLALDGFGYQNYHRCHCERCEELRAEYVEVHPEMTEDEASVAFFREMLVDYTNHLADYARSRRDDIRTSIHIWPVFVPEPLYGNRLDVDYCGQTAAWYTLWPQEKIAEYSRIIVEGAQKYHPRQQGVGMIGYYDRPGEFPVKDADRVEMELSTIIDNGCRRIQVCSSIHVINNEEIAGVFRRHFR